MKKLLLLILISIGQIQANNTNTIAQNITKKEKVIAFIESAKNKGIFLSKKSLDVFKFTVDKADKVFSKKFLIASAILIAPVIYAYSKFINPKQAEIVIEEISHVVAKKTTDIVAATTKGAIKGITESAVENKSTIGLYYLAANAIPLLVWMTGSFLGPFLNEAGKGLGGTIKFVSSPILKSIGTQTGL